MSQKHKAECNNSAGEPFILFIRHFIVVYGKIRGVVRVHYVVEAVVATLILSALIATFTLVAEIMH